MKYKKDDYIRTKDGIIDKVIIDYNGHCNSPNCNCKHVSCKYNYYDEDTIIKSSPNIIDLIEEGDIVKIEYQGWHQVSIKFETLKFFDDEGTEYLYDEIRAIITREQLENMEYKVGD